LKFSHPSVLLPKAFSSLHNTNTYFFIFFFFFIFIVFLFIMILIACCVFPHRTTLPFFIGAIGYSKLLDYGDKLLKWSGSIFSPPLTLPFLVIPFLFCFLYFIFLVLSHHFVFLLCRFLLFFYILVQHSLPTIVGNVTCFVAPTNLRMIFVVTSWVFDLS